MEVPLRHASSLPDTPPQAGLKPQSTGKVTKFQHCISVGFGCLLFSALARGGKDKRTFLRQSKACSSWLCDTGGEKRPTTQLLAWTCASFAADISPSAKSNQNSVIFQLPWKPHLQPVQGSLASASSSHASECLVGRRMALWDTPALVYWTRAYSHLQVRHNTCEDRGIIPCVH